MNKELISNEEFKNMAKSNVVRIIPKDKEVVTVSSLKEALNYLPDDSHVEINNDDGITIIPNMNNCNEECCQCDRNKERENIKCTMNSVMDDAGLGYVPMPIDCNGEPTKEEEDWEIANLHPIVGIMTENIRFNNEDIAQYVGNMAYTTAKTVFEYLTQAQCHMAHAVHKAALIDMCEIVDK